MACRRNGSLFISLSRQSTACRKCCGKDSLATASASCIGFSQSRLRQSSLFGSPFFAPVPFGVQSLGCSFHEPFVGTDPNRFRRASDTCTNQKRIYWQQSDASLLRHLTFKRCRSRVRPPRRTGGKHPVGKVVSEHPLVSTGDSTADSQHKLV